MKEENRTTVITDQKLCKWIGFITIVAAVILFIFDWLNGNFEWDYSLVAAAFGLMCIYSSKPLKRQNEN